LKLGWVNQPATVFQVVLPAEATIPDHDPLM
jgi:hypothetical protein